MDTGTQGPITHRAGRPAVAALSAGLLALLAAGCGGSGSSAYSHQPASSAPAQSAPAAAKPTPSSSAIPQNGGGDNDADNHGGPSDGDGNL